MYAPIHTCICILIHIIEGMNARNTRISTSIRMDTKYPHTHIMDSFPRWICFSSSFALALPFLLPSMTPADKGLESSVKEVAGEQVMLFNHHFQHVVT